MLLVCWQGSNHRPALSFALAKPTCRENVYNSKRSAVCPTNSIGATPPQDWASHGMLAYMEVLLNTGVTRKVGFRGASMTCTRSDVPWNVPGEESSVAVGGPRRGRWEAR